MNTLSFSADAKMHTTSKLYYDKWELKLLRKNLSDAQLKYIHTLLGLYGVSKRGNQLPDAFYSRKSDCNGKIGNNKSKEKLC